MAGRGRFASIAVAVLVGAAASAARAAPILPMLDGHALNFGASNTDGVIEYQTHGANPDTLAFTQNGGDQEVTTYWPDWPGGVPTPVWNESDTTLFGGDFVLNLMLDGEDAPPGGEFNISLTGTTGSVQIHGTLGSGAGAPSGLLWDLVLDQIALYGDSGSNTFVLEAVGTIMGGIIADDAGIVGDSGLLRGHLDFDVPWMPASYDPASDVTEEHGASYSGQTGLLPEPGTLAFILGGLAAIYGRRAGRAGTRAERRPA